MEVKDFCARRKKKAVMPTPPPPAVPISTTSAWSARVAKKYYYVPGLRSQLALRKKLIKYEKLKKSKTPSMSTHRKSTTFRETHRKSTTYDEYSSKVPPSQKLSRSKNSSVPRRRYNELKEYKVTGGSFSSFT